MENLTATNDQFGCIDLSNNDIQVLEKVPKLTRLTTLLLNNNKIAKIEESFAEDIQGLENLMLTNNSIGNIAEIDTIALSCPNLQRLSLIGNLVCNFPNYRLYTIFKIKPLRVLDFQKVSKKEREQAEILFAK